MSNVSKIAIAAVVVLTLVSIAIYIYSYNQAASETIHTRAQNANS